MKKTAAELVKNLIDGHFDVSNPDSVTTQELYDSIEKKINDEYSFTQEEFLEALQSQKDALSSKTGVELTSEQLALIAGGKSNATVATNSAIVGGVVGGTAALSGAAFLTAGIIVFVK